MTGAHKTIGRKPTVILPDSPGSEADEELRQDAISITDQISVSCLPVRLFLHILIG
jgi:hypothetical protein